MSNFTLDTSDFEQSDKSARELRMLAQKNANGTGLAYLNGFKALAFAIVAAQLTWFGIAYVHHNTTAKQYYQVYEPLNELKDTMQKTGHVVGWVLPFTAAIFQGVVWAYQAGQYFFTEDSTKTMYAQERTKGVMGTRWCTLGPVFGLLAFDTALKLQIVDVFHLVSIFAIIGVAMPMLQATSEAFNCYTKTYKQGWAGANLYPILAATALFASVFISLLYAAIYIPPTYTYYMVQFGIVFGGYLLGQHLVGVAQAMSVKSTQNASGMRSLALEGYIELWTLLALVFSILSGPAHYGVVTP